MMGRMLVALWSVALVDLVIGFNPLPVVVNSGPRVQPQTATNGVVPSRAMPGQRSSFVPATSAGSSFLPPMGTFDPALSASQQGQVEEAAWREPQMLGSAEEATVPEVSGGSWYGGFAAGVFAGFSAVFLALRSRFQRQSSAAPLFDTVEMRQNEFSMASSPGFAGAEPVYSASPELRGALQGAQVAHFAPPNTGASKLARAQMAALSGRSTALQMAAGAGYSVDLTGKVAFVAGVADASGYGWAIAKQLANAGATIVIGTWPPVLSLFERGLKKGFGEDQKLLDGSDMKIAKIYPLDAMFSNPSEVPDDVKNNKRYAGLEGYDIESCAKKVAADFGKVDILVHSLANGPEVTKPLLETTRSGYLAASSASAYSLVSLLQHFGPHMNAGGSVLSLTFIASERVVPGYGGGMSSAKAQLESDTKVLAWEAGRKFGVRVNTISAGPLASRAATAIKKGEAGERNFIDYCIDYNIANTPLPDPLQADDIGRTALALCSELTSAVSGVTMYVDNGMHSMGLMVDSRAFEEYVDKMSGDPWDDWKPDKGFKKHNLPNPFDKK